MELLGQSALIVGISSAAAASTVLARNARSKLSLSFAFLSLTVSLWALSYFFHLVWPHRNLYSLHLLFNAWIGPAGLLLIGMLLKLQDRVSRALLGIAILAALAASVVILFGWSQHEFFLQANYFSPIFLVIQVTRQFFKQSRLWRELGTKGSRGASVARDPRVVAAIRGSWIYFGGFIALSTSLMDHVPSLGQALPALGNLFLTIYIFFLGQAVSQQRLFNIAATVSRVIVVLILALILALLFVSVVIWVDRALPLVLLNSFFISFLVIALIEPLNRLVVVMTSLLVPASQKGIEAQVRQLAQGLTREVDPERLFDRVLSATESLLDPRRSVLYTLTSDGTRYRQAKAKPAQPAGTENERIREVLADYPLVRRALQSERRGESPLILDQILEGEIERSASRARTRDLREMVDCLHALEGNLFIPFIDSGKCLGFVVITIEGPPVAWGGSWSLLSVIYPYYASVSRVFSRLEVYVRQREKERMAALGEMAAGLAHEIRNPLGTIKGAAQLLYDDLAKEGGGPNRLTHAIVEESDRLNRVVTQFLNYSKPIDLELKPLDLRELLRGFIERVSQTLPEGVALLGEKNLGDKGATLPAPLWVMANRDQLVQVLHNMVQNAVRGLAKSGTRGQVRLYCDLTRAGEAVIRVEDNGEGISPENIKKIFIPFFTTSPEGTGLGLSISQKFMEAMRGRIEVLSQPRSSKADGKTVFSLFLQIAEETHGG